MPKKLSKEQFIERAKLIHGDKYDYSLAEYTNCDTKVKIICKEHGVFEQTPYIHCNLKGGCKKCIASKRVKRKSLEELKIKFKNIDFTLVEEYKNNEQLLDLKCKFCGNFFQRTYKDLQRGRGCTFCQKGTKKGTKEFIWNAEKIHGDKYDYSLVEYKNARTKVKIICKKCGKIFYQTPDSHLGGDGCSYCSNNHNFTTDEWIKLAKLVHGNRYDYSLVEYKNARTKVKIICNKCGKVFFKTPYTHLKGSGCSFCKDSKGEELIRKVLIEKNIEFESQKKFDDLKDGRNLSYDFYIPSKNLLIEYNGIQHYKYIPYFQKKYKNFLLQKHHDWLKRKYAKNNGITLLVIPFTDYAKIEEILLKELF